MGALQLSEQGTFRRTHPLADALLFEKSLSTLFGDFWFESIKPRPLPTMVTPEGDLIVFARSRFDVTDAAALREALSTQADVEQGDQRDTWSWLEDDREGGRRSLAHLRLDGRGLLVESQSKQRAARARSWLEAAAGTAVHHRTTRFESVARAIKRRKAEVSKQPDADAIPFEVQEQALRDFKDRHYRKWLDEPLPALGGRTPSEAVRLKTRRPRVVDLLKDLEVAEARAGQRGQPRYEAAWLWEALGLERF